MKFFRLGGLAAFLFIFIVNAYSWFGPRADGAQLSASINEFVTIIVEHIGSRNCGHKGYPKRASIGLCRFRTF